MTDLVDNVALGLDEDRPLPIDTSSVRPPDIEQDVKEMERRRRVKMIIESQIFKEELERIIETQLNEGYSSSTLSALQQVTELLLPGGTAAHLSGKVGAFIAPINDIRGIDAYRFVRFLLFTSNQIQTNLLYF
jgi:adducin